MREGKGATTPKLIPLEAMCRARSNVTDKVFLKADEIM
jgi:hypothetical protein